MSRFTPTQGRYLAFIQNYTDKCGCPPAESDMARAMCVAPPSVNQMVKMLEKKGLIHRQPGVPRSLRVIVPAEEIPDWNGRKPATPAGSRTAVVPTAPVNPPANLYAVTVFLKGGPVSKKFENKETSRAIEIRGDQTLDQLHRAIFDAYDRWEDHPYQF